MGAAIGFGVVPSRRLAAHAVGAVITGVAGVVGKSRIRAFAEDADVVVPTIAAALVDAQFSGSCAKDRVRQIRAAVQGLKVAFKNMYGRVYAKHLLGMVKYDPRPKTAELAELEKLKAALDLDSSAELSFEIVNKSRSIVILTNNLLQSSNTQFPHVPVSFSSNSFFYTFFKAYADTMELFTAAKSFSIKDGIITGPFVLTVERGAHTVEQCRRTGKFRIIFAESTAGTRVALSSAPSGANQEVAIIDYDYDDDGKKVAISNSIVKLNATNKNKPISVESSEDEDDLESFVSDQSSSFSRDEHTADDDSSFVGLGKDDENISIQNEDVESISFLSSPNKKENPVLVQEETSKKVSKKVAKKSTKIETKNFTQSPPNVSTRRSTRRR